MADIERLRKNLEDRGIRSSYFATAQAAADYLDRQIDGTTVGIGGSMTVSLPTTGWCGTGREAAWRMRPELRSI